MRATALLRSQMGGLPAAGHEAHEAHEALPSGRGKSNKGKMQPSTTKKHNLERESRQPDQAAPTTMYATMSTTASSSFSLSRRRRRRCCWPGDLWTWPGLAWRRRRRCLDLAH